MKRFMMLIALILSVLLITGCKKNNVEDINIPNTEVETNIDDDSLNGNTVVTDNPVNETENKTPEVTSIELSFSVVNYTGVDIGMISTLDPESGEQLNLGGLEADKALILKMEWPLSKTDFNLAVYNMNGDLVSESVVDITGATQSVTIELIGDHSLDNVSSQVY